MSSLAKNNSPLKPQPTEIARMSTPFQQTTEPKAPHKKTSFRQKPRRKSAVAFHLLAALVFALNAAIAPRLHAQAAATNLYNLNVTTNLVVWLDFTNGPATNASGAIVIRDLSPGGANWGTVTNSPTWVASQDGRQGAMFFNGNDPDGITIQPASDLDSTVGTIAFWMESTNVTSQTSSSLFDRYASATGTGAILYQNASGTLSSMGEPDGSDLASSLTTAADVTDGKWHHVAFVYDQPVGNTCSLYLDGALAASAVNKEGWFWENSQELEIGFSDDSSYDGYTGYLADFRVYNRELSPSEVATLAGLASTPQIAIQGQPQSTMVAANDTASFAVQAAVANGVSTNLAYQWQESGTNILNATNATYSFTTALSDSGATFQVVLSYPGTTNLLSAQATLTVIPDVVVIYSFATAPANNVIVNTWTNAPSLTNSLDGVNNGATWVASQDGRQGVMYFDGNATNETNQITLAASPELDSTRGTIAFWMESSNVTQLPNPCAMLVDRRAGVGSGPGDVIYQGPDGHLDNQAEETNGTVVNTQETSVTTTNSQWHHIAYVYDQSASGFVSFYVDGFLNTTCPNSQPWSWDPSEEIEIGRSHDPWWAGYTGYLADFRIYNWVLAPAEIAQLAGLGSQPVLAITVQPASLAVGTNDLAKFSVAGIVDTGDTSQIAYAWQENGTNVPGATNATYSFTAAAADNGASFQAVLSYPGATSVTSAVATLTALPDFVVHFEFAGNPSTNNNIVVDSSPVGTNSGLNGGTLYGPATWVAIQDGRTNVMSFDPTVPSQITIAPNPTLNSVRGTIAFWMEAPVPSTSPDYVDIVDHRSSVGDAIYQVPNGNISDQAILGPGQVVCSLPTSVNLSDDKWHHLAYLYDQTAGGFVSFYVDGVLNVGQSNNVAWSWDPNKEIEIGRSDDPWWAGYSGYLADFRIYSRVLSASEIAQLAGLPAAPPLLSITVANGQLTLSWSAAGFVLQQNSSLANSSGWANVPNGNVSPVKLAVPATGAGFYRLKGS